MAAPTLQAIPFVPGRRPTDEARHPGHGSSDQVAFRMAGAGGENRCYLLFSASGLEQDAGCALDATLSGIADWQRRPVPATVFEPGPDGGAVLKEVALAEVGERPLVLALAPDVDLPGDYGFAQQLTQRVAVELRLTRDGAPVATASVELDVYDVGHFGDLYERLVERLVRPDTARQAQAAGAEALGHAYHPWFPVLLIGSHKAELYTRALIGDVVGKRRNLADPGWLVRVGLYLELLTCLGIAEAVRDEVGDLLSADERAAFEHGEAYAEVRARLNPAGWSEVWQLRSISFPRAGTPRTGPVSALNLLAKRRATLAFLHVHHADLEHAIALAGANVHDAQETWHRVFRDAERAVLRMTPDAFPELGFMPREVRDRVLWHRRGHVGLRRALRVPGPLPRLLGDQDGLFASACNQYRASMNHVAERARAVGLMDHTGSESVPRQVSLLEAHMNQPARVALLQRRDGYDAERLEVGAELPEHFEPPLVAAQQLLADAPLFALLEPEELRVLAQAARPLTLGPAERIIVQGEQGDSLFVVAEGEVEVILRGDDGAEVTVDTLRDGAIIGEMSLLTGAPRSATVRAIDGAVVYEIGPSQYEPLLELRPRLAEELAREMVARLAARGELLADRDADHQHDAIAQRLRRLFGSR